MISADFDGADEIRRAWLGGLAPDPALTVSEWADRHRILSSRAASEAGPYRTDRTPFMRGIMDALSPSSRAQRVVFMKSAQVGAPLALDTPIPTPSGWTTMGDLAAGDEVFDEKGLVVRVSGVSPVFLDRECFRVVFSDGESIVASGDHLWTVDDALSRVGAERTLTTAEMAGAGRVGNRNLHYKVGRRNRYAIPLPDALHLPASDLPIQPYTFGVWLGDGNSASNQITTHQDDAEEIAGYMTSEGHRTTVRRPAWVKGNCLNLIIEQKEARGNVCRRGHDMNEVGAVEIKRRGRVDLRCAECNRQSAMASKYGRGRDPVIEPPAVYSSLKALGVIRNKHIPAAYLRSSLEQRLNLLQGLMDTDGSVDHRGRCELTVADDRLAEDCVELIRSLGYKPTTSRRQTNEVVQGRAVKVRRWHTRISFMAYAERPVFRLRRKLERMVDQEGKRTSETFRRRIVAISPVPSVPTRCISVASDRHLFLAGRGMIATHNTEAGNNWIGFCMHRAPGPFLAVQPTVDLAKRLSQQRIDPLIEESPELRALVLPSRSRDSGNTILGKRFPGGQLILTGANSAVGLRSMPARWVFLDEVDAYPGDLDGEGDPIALAEARTISFGHRSKVFLASTPTIKGLSRIEREYERSDQQRYHVPCPNCGALQWLKFERLRWEAGRPETVHYQCEHCDDPFFDRQKARFLSEEHGARWIATADAETQASAKSAGIVGFHISGLYSPLGWLSWEDIARQWEAAAGNEAAIKTLKNTVLGETWQERGEAPDWQRLYDRREEYQLGQAPEGVLVLTAGADVQRDRIEIDVWGWGRDGQSWLVDHVVLDGDTARPEVWAKLTEFMVTTWPHEGGAHLSLARMAIDTGDGATTDAVYAWVRQMGRGQAIAIKGVPGFDRSTPVDGPTYVETTEAGRKLKRGVQLWKVAGAVFKSETYRFLRLNPPTDEEREAGAGWPAGYVHIPKGTPAEWMKQLVAEQLMTTRTKQGFQKLEWQQTRDRNEALDCRVYARAAAWLMGIDRWDTRRWEALEEQINTGRAATAPPAGVPSRPAQTQQPRRASDWMPRRRKGWF